MALGSQGAQKVIVMQELTVFRFQVYHQYSVTSILQVVTPISFLKKLYCIMLTEIREIRVQKSTCTRIAY